MKIVFSIGVAIFFIIGCKAPKEDTNQVLQHKLEKVISNYPNYHIEKVQVQDKKLDIFIADSLDVNNGPFTNEFLVHFLQKIRNQIINFDSVSIDLRMIHRESSYPEKRLYLDVKQLIQVFNERDKIHSYVDALEWIFENDYRVVMEVANVSYASSRGIKDIWSLEDNIFVFMQKYYNNCKEPLILYIAKEIESDLNPNTNIYQKRAKEICNKIFSNCKWKNPI